MADILYIDKQLFYFFNQVIAYAPLDHVMAFISSQTLALFIGVGLFSYAAITKKWHLLAVLCFLAIAVGVADFTAYNIVKPLFARIRPCHIAPELVRTVQGCGGRYGFPSNHAVNLAAATFFIWRYFGWKFGRLVLGMALLVGLSRIYLGVHFPLDVVAGYVYGLLIGWCVYSFGVWVANFYFERSVVTELLQISSEGEQETRVG